MSFTEFSNNIAFSPQTSIYLPVEQSPSTNSKSASASQHPHQFLKDTTISRFSSSNPVYVKNNEFPISKNKQENPTHDSKQITNESNNLNIPLSSLYSSIKVNNKDTVTVGFMFKKEFYLMELPEDCILIGKNHKMNG